MDLAVGLDLVRVEHAVGFDSEDVMAIDCRVKGIQIVDSGGDQTCLFQQFTLRGFLSGFARIHAAAGQHEDRLAVRDQE